MNYKAIQRKKLHFPKKDPVVIQSYFEFLEIDTDIRFVLLEILNRSNKTLDKVIFEMVEYQEEEVISVSQFKLDDLNLEPKDKVIPFYKVQITPSTTKLQFILKEALDGKEVFKEGTWAVSEEPKLGLEIERLKRVEISFPIGISFLYLILFLGLIALGYYLINYPLPF